MRDGEKTVISTAVGWAIGYFLDQTKFGVWFNNNRTIDIIWKTIGVAIGVFALWCSILVVYYFFTL